VTGFFGGATLVNEILEHFGVDDPEDLPPEHRAAAYSARSLGGAAGLAEVVAPGETGTRVTAEIAGGILAPGNLTTSVYRSTKRGLTKLWGQVSPSARETAAGLQLQEMLQMTDEDPKALIEMLKIDGVLDANGAPITEGMTAAQATGSDALSALQKFLTDSNPDFRASVALKEKDSLDAMRGMANTLAKLGDPEALKAAGEAKSMYVRSLLQTLVDNQTQKALLDAQQIAKDSPEALAGISTATREALDTTISEVRKAERAMWDAVPKDVDAPITALETTFRELKADMLPELMDEKMPKVVIKFLSRKAAEAKGVPEDSLLILPESARTELARTTKATSGELKALRSELNDLARSATKAGEFNQARIYSDLAAAALDDIDAAFANVADEAYKNARNFSFEMNETFTRSFIGKATGQGRYGDQVAPELLLRKAMASGKEAGAMHFQQLEDATRFLEARQMGNDVTREAAETILDGQERFTRLMFDSAVDPETGLVNTKRLSSLMKENEALLNRFPEVKAQLKAARASEKERKAIEDFVKGKVRHLEQMKAYEKIAGADPVAVAKRALASTNPEKAISDMVAATKGGARAGFDAQAALRGVTGSVMQSALDTATDTTGRLNLEKFREIIAGAPVSGGKSALDTLKVKKAIDPQHYDAIQEMFKVLDSIEKAKSPGHAVKIGTDMTDAALRLVSRVAGTAVSRKAGVKTIQGHGAAANFAEKIGDKLTKVKMDEIFIRALNDKDFMITLLEKADTPQAIEQQARQINAWLSSAALDITRTEDEDE
jgi:hypothetical protein